MGRNSMKRAQPEYKAAMKNVRKHLEPSMLSKEFQELRQALKGRRKDILDRYLVSYLTKKDFNYPDAEKYAMQSLIHDILQSARSKSGKYDREMLRIFECLTKQKRETIKDMNIEQISNLLMKNGYCE